MEELIKYHGIFIAKKEGLALEKIEQQLGEKLRVSQEDPYDVLLDGYHVVGLDLSYRSLENVPLEIGDLLQLRNLSLLGNRIIQLPEILGELVFLEEMDISMNRNFQYSSNPKMAITSILPDIFYNMKHLRVFNAYSNMISEIPVSFDSLDALRSIQLSTNSLKLFPNELCNKPNLIELKLYSNQIQRFETEITNLGSLKILDLHSNKFDIFPKELAKITNLTKLILSQNVIQSIGDEISGLINLTELDLSDNKLSEIPECLMELKNLTHLRLRRNSINRIPESILKLKNLEILDLDENKITEVPDSLSSMKNLKELYLDFNNLATLPESIFKITSLEKLEVACEGIDFDLNLINNLVNLKSINISEEMGKTYKDHIKRLRRYNLEIFINGSSSYEFYEFNLQ